ncbi:MAG: family 16 glycoside hydrolase [Chloroflexota bacterium]
MERNQRVSSQRGQGLGEYALLLVLVAIGVLLLLQLMGISVREAYCRTIEAITGSPACAPQEYCGDDFTGGMDAWRTALGQPTSQDGKLCLQDENRTFNNCSMEQGQGDYVIRMDDVVLDKGNGYGVFFRTTDTSDGASGYIFQYDPGMKYHGYAPNGAYIIRRWVNGREVWTPIAAAPLPDGSVYDTPHDIEIIVEGDTFTVNVDGQQVLQATDSTYDSGGVGLRSWDSTQVCSGGYSLLPAP